MSDRESRLTEFIVKVFEEWIGKVQKVVQAAQAAGQMRKDISAAIMAGQIVMTLEGGIMMARLKKNEKPLKACLKSLRTLLGLKI
jgi:TetR/AcrR family transcriptional repressor of nem operon